MNLRMFIKIVFAIGSHAYELQQPTMMVVCVVLQECFFYLTLLTKMLSCYVAIFYSVNYMLLYTCMLESCSILLAHVQLN